MNIKHIFSSVFLRMEGKGSLMTTHIQNAYWNYNHTSIGYLIFGNGAIGHSLTGISSLPKGLLFVTERQPE